MFSEKTFSKDEECDVEIQCRCVEMYTNKNSSDIKALGEQVVFFLSFPPFFHNDFLLLLGENDSKIFNLVSLHRRFILYLI